MAALHRWLEARISGEGDGTLRLWAMFVKVILQSMSSPAKTVDLPQITETEMFDIVLKAHTLRPGWWFGGP